MCIWNSLMLANSDTFSTIHNERWNVLKYLKWTGLGNVMRKKKPWEIRESVYLWIQTNAMFRIICEQTRRVIDKRCDNKAIKIKAYSYTYSKTFFMFQLEKILFAYL